MKRRELLKTLGIGSLMGTLPGAWSALAHGATNNDRLWIVINPQGAWDPLSFCNPRTKDNFFKEGSTPMSNYSQDMLGQAGNIRYVNMLSPLNPSRYGNFVEKYYKELLVVNGIETNTSNHIIGQAIAVSGHASAAYPTFAAYAASLTLNANKLPLPYMVNDKFQNTAKLISKVPIESASDLINLIEPFQQNGTAMFPAEILADLEKTQRRNMRSQQQASTLPRQILEQKAFQDSYLSKNELARLKQYVPSNLEANALKRRSQLICASMAAGLTVSAQLGGGNWDTHADHDARASKNLTELFDALDFLLIEAERQGIRDRLNLVMASDFGRTPFYNPEGGKDHWSVGSMLFLGPDFSGNRMVQLDDAKVLAKKVDLNTLKPSNTGEIVTMRHIFRSLRELTGPINSALDLQFDLAAPSVPKLFTG